MFVRWDNLTRERDEADRLPGVGAAPVVRTFDAPEAMGIRFHEVHARSAINDVPPMARVDFRHTINPYRGCSHACAFCLSGYTEVLMADGNTRPISDLNVGDEIYGTRFEGRYRRYVKTEVRAHWETRKEAFRLTLENGTAITCSGDHRFLTDRGWKFVSGTEQGRSRRPHLTLNNRLLGFGESAPSVAFSDEYARGYLCGMLRGDGCVGSWQYGKSRTRWVHSMRLALTDSEALDRSREFLRGVGVETRKFEFSPETSKHRAVAAITTARKDDVERCRELMQLPRRQEPEWLRGFLAGIFDAEGSCGGDGGPIRVVNTDPELISAVYHGLLSLGFEVRLEPPRTSSGGKELWCVRLLGGLPAKVRFFQLTNPSISRKRDFAGTAVKGKNPLRLVDIEPLGYPVEMFDITTGTGDFIANGVISHNCFARPTHRYLDLDPATEFEREIVVKVNLPEVLRAELRRPSWKGEHIALGTNTDPYQWVESKYGITRGIWEELLEARNPCSILTRSPLLLRDLDLFRELSEKTEFSANLSIPTIDQKVWRETEPGSPNPMKRIEALRELTDAGIRTGVLVAPLMPGINDSPEQVERILELCGEAGASSIGGIGLHLRGPLKTIFLDWLRQYRPDLLERYERLYARGGYLPRTERARLQRMLRGGKDRSIRRSPRRREREEPAPEPHEREAEPEFAAQTLF